MGNRLTASSLNELLPLEAYINDLTFDNSIESLGSTRFMKVARAANSAGCQVWKVFVMPDDSFDLSEYTKEFHRIATQCSPLPGCCPFTRIHAKPKYVVICRAYQRYTLFDRLTTRPFTVPIERLWYVYQLLRALSQSHNAGVCHGDLKSQNILVTSSGWIQMTDFAFFKPTFLPEDDPSIFTYFFDTSRRQTCYIAPERIRSPSEYAEIGGLNSNKPIFADLIPSMDIFSVACVILEILNDGHPPFTFAQLCRYRKMTDKEAKEHANQLVKSTGPMADILKRMLSRNPKNRPTADAVLKESNLFPEFLSFLYSYLNVFRPKETLPPSSSQDELLGSQPTNAMEADDVIAKLINDESTILSRLSQCDCPRDSAVFFISLITCNIRAIRSSSSRIRAMRMVVSLSRYTSSSISIQRVLPYLVTQISPDKWFDPRMASFAIDAIAHLVYPLSPETLEDSLIFIDYLFPKFEVLVHDASPSSLLLSLAKHLGRFAECALRFWRVRRDLKAKAAKEEDLATDLSSANSEEHLELSSMCKQMSDLFTGLAARDEVKMCLATPASLTRLHDFFMAQEASWKDLPLHHMIPLLNAKGDWRMRATCFDALPLIVKKRFFKVLPLIQQGLDDSCEMVVIRALSCARLLSSSCILEDSDRLTLINDVAPFLIHPNECIRGETAELVVCIEGQLSMADSHCKLVPIIRPLLDRQLIRLNYKCVLLQSLKSPIPRESWNKVTTYDVEGTRRLIDHLDRLLPLGAIASSHVLGPISTDSEVLNKLKFFISHLLKMAEFRASFANQKETFNQRERIELGELDNVILREHTLTASGTDSFATSVPNPSLRMCDASMAELLEELQREHSWRTGGGNRTIKTNATIGGLSGKLVNHLHEHSGKVTQMALSPDGSRVASCSSDGSFKIWSSCQMAGDSYGAVRSDVTHQMEVSHNEKASLTGIGWTPLDAKMVVSTKDGQLVWMDASSSIKEVSKVILPPEDGAIEEISISGHLVYTRSHHGSFHCFDSRVGISGGGNHEVWKRKASNAHARVTSFCIDKVSDRWMVFSGTSNKLSLWDLRLVVEVAVWNHPAPAALPLRVWSSEHLKHHDVPEILVGNSVCGELSLFNLNTGSRSTSFWPSHQRPVLDYDSKNLMVDYNKATSAVAVEEGGWVLVGDTRGELRKWNYYHPHLSAYLSGVSDLTVRSGPIKYQQSQMVIPPSSSIVVTYERTDRSCRMETPPLTSQCHLSAISNLLVIPSQQVAVSSSSDGSIKVWK